MTPCGKCGSTDRNNGGKCRACQKARSAAWREAHIERERARHAAAYRKQSELVKARSAAWYAANKERAASTGAARYAADAPKKRQQAAQWRAANLDRAKRNGKAWQQSNRAKVNAAAGRWRRANPEKRAAINAAWRMANPGRARSYYSNRRARRRRGGKLSGDIATRLLALQKGQCAACRRRLRGSYHLDHVIPLAKDGGNVDGNMQLLCPHCNRQKGAKHPVDFMQSRGFLL